MFLLMVAIAKTFNGYSSSVKLLSLYFKTKCYLILRKKIKKKIRLKILKNAL